MLVDFFPWKIFFSAIFDFISARILVSTTNSRLCYLLVFNAQPTGTVISRQMKVSHLDKYQNAELNGIYHHAKFEPNQFINGQMHANI